jgi:hypothetical protein
MHKTETGEKAKALKKEAQELARRAKAAMKAAETLPEAGEKARKLKSQADNLKAEAENLKEAARLEDLTVWVMEKVSPQRKATGPITIGWLHGERAGRCGTCILGTVGRWMKRPPSRKPGR